MHLILEWTQCMTHRNGPQIRGYCCIFVRISTAPIFLKIKIKALRICGCICRVFYGSTNTDLRIGMSGDLDIQKYYVYCKERKKRFFHMGICRNRFRKTYNFTGWTYTTSRRTSWAFLRESKNSFFCFLCNEWKHRTRKNTSVS